MEQEGIRINKFLSEAGVCSRREADRRLALGEIAIDGKTAQPGDRVLPGQQVIYCGRMVSKEEEKILLLVNKPVGIVCTAEKRERNNIVDFLGYPKRVYPVGRLDKDSGGLLLMTNQGDLVNKIMRAGNMHEKEYIVRVSRPVTPQFIKGMSEGVPLRELGAVTRKCKVEQLEKYTFRIILTQGMNRQIRRMCEFWGYQVKELTRVRIMNLELGDLKPGTYRKASPQEYRELLELLAGSSSESVYVQEGQETGGQTWNRNRHRSGGRN